MTVTLILNHFSLWVDSTDMTIPLQPQSDGTPPGKSWTARSKEDEKAEATWQPEGKTGCSWQLAMCLTTSWKSQTWSMTEGRLQILLTMTTNHVKMLLGNLFNANRLRVSEPDFPQSRFHHSSARPTVKAFAHGKIFMNASDVNIKMFHRNNTWPLQQALVNVQASGCSNGLYSTSPFLTHIFKLENNGHGIPMKIASSVCRRWFSPTWNLELQNFGHLGQVTLHYLGKPWAWVYLFHWPMSKWLKFSEDANT